MNVAALFVRRPVMTLLVMIGIQLVKLGFYSADVVRPKTHKPAHGHTMSCSYP